jgi:hypothetical protein
MKQSYDVCREQGAQSGLDSRGCRHHDNYEVDYPYGIFSMDASRDPRAYSEILGSIAYLLGKHRFDPEAVYRSWVSDVEYENNVAYIEPGTHPGTKPFALKNALSGGTQNVIARNLTANSSSPPEFSSAWQTSNIAHGSSVSQTGDIYTNPKGARICKRYKDGVLTSEPLWPWPMNQRIIDAMKQAGREPVDVTATIEKLFGPIPSECRSSGGGPPVPGPCHTLDSGQAVPAGYGAAYNVHSAQKELLITAQCEADRTDTEIGSGNAPLYVYHSGWGWNGSRWVPQSYACETEKIANAWCVGKAKGVVPAGIPWFVGYTCFWNGSAWKCGCRDAACAQSYWQLQGINR